MFRFLLWQFMQINSIMNKNYHHIFGTVVLKLTVCNKLLWQLTKYELGRETPTSVLVAESCGHKQIHNIHMTTDTHW